MGDGFPSDEDIPATFSSNRVVGDIYPQGGDSGSQRLVDTTVGAGLFTTNSDPNVVSVDPLTGANAPVGTDVGFGSAIRRFIHTGVLNGDFSLPPPDIDQAITNANPLPYWTWSTNDGNATGMLVADATYASGYRLDVTFPSSSPPSYGQIEQLVPIPRSYGQQYRVLPSLYTTGASAPQLFWQYVTSSLAGIGSESFFAGTSGQELRIDAGLVPPTASYIRLRARVYGNLTSGTLAEVRAAFLPAEASLGLGSITANSGNIDSITGETVVKAVTIPANTFVVGSVYRITAWATVTSTVANVVTIRVRIGPTTLTGAIVESINPTATTTATDDGVRFDAMVTVRSVGATGTVMGALSFLGNATQPFSQPQRTDVATATTTIDTTVANLLELTAVTAGGNTDINFRQATIECVMAS